mmetsp:Transcript_20127/g.60014  ORF Transcript_20127/g.60014 Transcript_20127/m.60014 type:complete len:206 (-) Transcript_20127:147-764(-)
MLAAWNAVSGTATCGASQVSRAKVMPRTLAGLCSGARAEQASISARTSSVTIFGPRIVAPPWTTRWPTAATEGTCGAKASRIFARPAPWSGIARLTSWRVTSAATSLRREASEPTSSSTPEQCSTGPSAPTRNAPNLMLLEPQLMVSTYLSEAAERARGATAVDRSRSARRTSIFLTMRSTGLRGYVKRTRMASSPIAAARSAAL